MPTLESRRKRRRGRSSVPSAPELDVTARVRVCIAALGAAVVLSALLLGGAWPVVALLTAALTLLAVLVQHRSHGHGVLPWVMLALAGYCLFQVLPIPIGLLRVLSSHAARGWERAAPGEWVSWASLSLDPGATCIEVVKWCSYGSALSASVWLAQRKGQIPGLAIVFISALATALLWGVHAGLGMDSLYGFYKPRFIEGESLAPILNRNNLAGYLILGLFCGLGLLSRERVGPFRPLIATGVAVLAGTVLMTRSTGGTAAFLIGMSALLLLGLASRRRSPARLAVLAGSTLIGLLVAALASPSESWIQLGKFSEKRLLVRWSLPLIRDYFAFGSGRGAFETVFPAYRQGTLGETPNLVIFTHPENVVVQWLAEWGVLVTVLAVGALGYGLFRGLRARTLAFSSLCALVGVGAVLLQNLADLGLELPATAVAVAVTLGTMLGNPARRPELRSVSSRFPRAFVSLAVALSLVGCIGLGRYGLQLAWQERDAAYAALSAVKGSPAENAGFFEMVRKQMRRRPAEPYFPLVAAQASQILEVNAMPWIGRALERDPTRGETHLVLALELARHGARLQALEAIRHSLEWDAGGLPRAIRLARAVSSDPEEVARAAPDGHLGTSFLLSAASAEGSYELRWGLVQVAATREPRSPEALRSRGHLLIEALNSQRTQCSGEQQETCVSTVRSIIETLRQVSARSTEALELDAALTDQQGHPLEAIARLQQGCAGVDEPARCLKGALEMAVRTTDPKLVDAVLVDYISATCKSPRECARGETQAGRALMQVKAPLKAFAHYKMAAEIEPSQASWTRAATAARAAGVEVLAKAAERKANRLGASGAP